jgi:adenylate kinase family enzyme
METLSDLTDEKVDELFHINSAPSVEDPVFVFMVGVPGVGKTTGHKELHKRGYLAPHSYATINLDTLLESLKVFRAASSMAHLLKQHHKELIKFGTIQLYQSHKDDLGIFKWYDDSREELLKRMPHTVKQLDTIRAKYALAAATATAYPSIQDLTQSALQRAIAKSVNIVYETTLSVPKTGRVAKVEEVLKLVGSHYRILVFHVQGAISEVALRIHGRQEFSTPYLALPFYRPMTTAEEVLGKIDKGNYDAIKALMAQYPEQIRFDEYKTVMNERRLPLRRSFTMRKQRHRIKTVYGPNKSSSGYSADRSASRSRSKSKSKSGSGSGSK